MAELRDPVPLDGSEDQHTENLLTKTADDEGRNRNPLTLIRSRDGSATHLQNVWFPPNRFDSSPSGSKWIELEAHNQAAAYYVGHCQQHHNRPVMAENAVAGESSQGKYLSHTQTQIIGS